MEHKAIFQDAAVSVGAIPNHARIRSDALLSKAELETFRASGQTVGFDPAQQGWVLLNSIDDIDPSAPPAVLSANHSVVQLYGRYVTGTTAQKRQITFRPWHAQDLPRYKALLDDPDVWAILPEAYPNPLTDDLARSLLELSNETGHHIVRAVLLDGVPVGQVRIVFAPGDPAREDAEISYWLGRDYWGLGIGARMVSAYVEEVVARFPSITTLIARINRDNTASARIARKAGFQTTGVADQDPKIEVYRLRLNAGLAENAGAVRRLPDTSSPRDAKGQFRMIAPSAAGWAPIRI
jgi:RimJ/RimL family protein N-acetyltransferase